MAKHMSVRLAWHSDGWNGHICKKPCENVYCVGQHSYPGMLIAQTRDLSYETEHAGQSCALHHCKVACGLSVNAFGDEAIQVCVDTPSWWTKEDANSAILTLPPYTVCTWGYDAMYNEDVAADSGSGKYDNDKRMRNVENYFSQFDEGKSLVFYYSPYSNPFSEDEENNFVIVGVSRLKKIHDFQYYENPTQHIKEKYAGGLIWQKPITSNYPDEGLCLPYWKYLDDEDAVARIVVKPQNREPYKYGSRVVSGDDAIEVIHQLIDSVDALIEMGDDTENWNVRRDWLNSLLNELWEDRGPYPGLSSVLEVVGLGRLVKTYYDIGLCEEKKVFCEQVEALLKGEISVIADVSFAEKELKVIRRNYQSMDGDVQELLLRVLPRFDLTKKQVENIISEKREDVSITAAARDMVSNPYIIFEQYVGMDAYDRIHFYKIDNGVIPSPELGLEEILDAGSTERLRALCIDELNRIPAHSFGKADTILELINNRLDRLPEWKKYRYTLGNLRAEREILDEGLFIRKDDEGTVYIYLKEVYEDERTVEEVFRMLADREDIGLRMTISARKFKDVLKDKKSKLLDRDETEEKYIEILNTQAEVCMQIFTKPICVLSGAAGTGKTTVIKSILETIEKVHGASTSFLLMAPTGKATERLKIQTGKKSSTIHSFLAKNGWINKNMTFRRSGGSISKDINTLILDECSMIDLSLFSTLCRAINWNSVQRLILVGDPNQLPPIGRGKVFDETIQWLKGEYPKNVGVLTENIRQLVNVAEGNGTGILDLANVYIQEKQKVDDDYDAAIKLKQEKESIFASILENGNGDVDKDLSVYFWQEQEDLEDLIKNRLICDMQAETGLTIGDSAKELNKLWTEAIKEGPERFQIISPYRGELYGTMAINMFVQKTFNGDWSSKLNIDGIGLFDKVIQIRNRPTSDKAYAYNWDPPGICRQEIYNGEIATVSPMGYEYNKIGRMNRLDHFQCNFSGRKGLSYLYGKKLGRDAQGKYIPEQNVLENLELAYAISVHKSQGSEFDYVYIVLPQRDSHLISMELLYTALTRAKRHVTVFIQQDISTLTTMSHIEKSAVRRINSSVFIFEPLPEEVLHIQNWYASERKLATLSDYFVRSKSEVIITNMLVAEDIPFEYETPLYAPDGTICLPDFTVTFRGEKYYWEHVGRLDLPEYKKHWEEKEKWYNKHFKGRLLTTYEGCNLSVDAKEIIDRYM